MSLSKKKDRPNIIGLTGGIGVGKTSVSNYLKEKGFIILDIDKIAKELIDNDSDILFEIEKAFGKEVIKDNKINRKILGQIVFNDKDKLKELNYITHPKIKDNVKEILNNLLKKELRDIIIDAAILFEIGLDEFTDQVWLVHTEKETQIKRLMSRNSINRQRAINIIEKQIDNEMLFSKVDEIIYNNSSLDELKKNINKLLNKKNINKDLKGDILFNEIK